MKKILLLVLLALIMTGCERDSSAPKSKSVTPARLVSYPSTPFLFEKVTPVLVETAAEALPIWRQYAPGRPTLLLLSSDPFLQPYPEQLKTAVLDLAKGVDQAARRSTAGATVANPVLLPAMALSAALDAGFFSKVIWQIPLKPETTLTLEQFRDRLVAQGILTEKEAAAFRSEGGAFVGFVRNIPILATTMIPEQSGPVLLHFDLSYLRAGYHNEIRQPLNQHVREMLQKLRDSHLQVIASTLSLSNVSGQLPLQTRFLGGMIGDILMEPQRLDQEMSRQEALRAEAMYLENFFRKDEVLEKYLEMEKAAPQDPSVKYDLYQTLRQFNLIEEALEKLRQAVAIDPIYGLEYVTLAEIAIEKQRPDGALEMYKKAAVIFPEDPFITLSMARIYLQLGRSDKVKEVLAPLQTVIWSDVYYPQMQAEVENLLLAARDHGK